MENKGNNNNNGGGNNNGKGGNNKNGMTILIFCLTALLVLFFVSMLNSCVNKALNQEISYSKFLEKVENDEVKSVVFDKGKIQIETTDNGKCSSENYLLHSAVK